MSERSSPATSAPLSTSGGLRAFDNEMAAFRHRVEQLRAASRLPSQPNDTLRESALLELHMANELLRVCRDELAASQERLVQLGDATRERQLLRSVYQHLPVGAVLLEPDGLIRRANHVAADLLGAPAGFVAGKPLAVFLQLSARSAFRSHLGAVLQDGEARAFTTVLVRRGEPTERTVTLSQLPVPGESGVPLLATFAGAEGPAAVHRAGSFATGKGATADLRRLTARLDALLAAAHRLVGARDDGLAAAVQALSSLPSTFADWLTVDVLADSAGLVRVHASGPPECPAPLLRQLAKLDPAEVPLSAACLDAGRPVLTPQLEDADALGVLPDGMPAAIAMQVDSAATVPITAAGTVLGVLTLARVVGHEPLDLGDGALVGELAQLIGSALACDPLARHIGRQPKLTRPASST